MYRRNPNLIRHKGSFKKEGRSDKERNFRFKMWRYQAFLLPHSGINCQANLWNTY